MEQPGIPCRSPSPTPGEMLDISNRITQPTKMHDMMFYPSTAQGNHQNNPNRHQNYQGGRPPTEQIGYPWPPPIPIQIPNVVLVPQHAMIQVPPLVNHNNPIPVNYRPNCDPRVWRNSQRTVGSSYNRVTNDQPSVQWSAHPRLVNQQRNYQNYQHSQLYRQYAPTVNPPNAISAPPNMPMYGQGVPMNERNNTTLDRNAIPLASFQEASRYPSPTQTRSSTSEETYAPVEESCATASNEANANVVKEDATEALCNFKNMVDLLKKSEEGRQYLRKIISDIDDDDTLAACDGLSKLTVSSNKVDTLVDVVYQNSNSIDNVSTVKPTNLKNDKESGAKMSEITRLDEKQVSSHKELVNNDEGAKEPKSGTKITSEEKQLSENVSANEHDQEIKQPEFHSECETVSCLSTSDISTCSKDNKEISICDNFSTNDKDLLEPFSQTADTSSGISTEHDAFPAENEKQSIIASNGDKKVPDSQLIKNESIKISSTKPLSLDPKRLTYAELAKKFTPPQDLSINRVQPPVSTKTVDSNTMNWKDNCFKITDKNVKSPSVRKDLTSSSSHYNQKKLLSTQSPHKSRETKPKPSDCVEKDNGVSEQISTSCISLKEEIRIVTLNRTEELEKLPFWIELNEISYSPIKKSKNVLVCNDTNRFAPLLNVSEKPVKPKKRKKCKKSRIGSKENKTQGSADHDNSTSAEETAEKPKNSNEFEKEAAESMNDENLLLNNSAMLYQLVEFRKQVAVGALENHSELPSILQEFDDVIEPRVKDDYMFNEEKNIELFEIWKRLYCRVVTACINVKTNNVISNPTKLHYKFDFVVQSTLSTGHKFKAKTMRDKAIKFIEKQILSEEHYQYNIFYRALKANFNDSFIPSLFFMYLQQNEAHYSTYQEDFLASFCVKPDINIVD